MNPNYLLPQIKSIFVEKNMWVLLNIIFLNIIFLIIFFFL